MPYIKQEARKKYEEAITPLLRLIRNAPPGELTWCISVLTDTWLQSIKHGYAEMALAIGIMETAKLEMYRRCVAPYEDRKKAENGEVYTLFPAEEDMH